MTLRHSHARTHRAMVLIFLQHQRRTTGADGKITDAQQQGIEFCGRGPTTFNCPHLGSGAGRQLATNRASPRRPATGAFWKVLVLY